MVGDLVKRFVNGVVVFFAALAFFFVPLGKKTAAQHVVSVFTTAPAREAGAALRDAAKNVYARMAGEARRLIPSGGPSRSGAR